MVRPAVLVNIQAQIVKAMFRPDLWGLDKAINISGTPEPWPGEGKPPDPSASRDKPRADQLADTLNYLRFETGEEPPVD